MVRVLHGVYCAGVNVSLCPPVRLSLHRATASAWQRSGAGAHDQGSHREECFALLQLVRLLLRHRGQRHPSGRHRQVSALQKLLAGSSERGFGTVLESLCCCQAVCSFPCLGRALTLTRCLLQLLPCPRLLLQEAAREQVQPPDNPLPV